MHTAIVSRAQACTHTHTHSCGLWLCELSPWSHCFFEESRRERGRKETAFDLLTAGEPASLVLVSL